MKAPEGVVVSYAELKQGDLFTWGASLTYVLLRLAPGKGHLVLSGPSLVGSVELGREKYGPSSTVLRVECVGAGHEGYRLVQPKHLTIADVQAGQFFQYDRPDAKALYLRERGLVSGLGFGSVLVVAGPGSRRVGDFLTDECFAGDALKVVEPSIDADSTASGEDEDIPF